MTNDLPKIKCPYCGCEAISMFDLLDAIEYPCGTFQSTMRLDAEPQFSDRCIAIQKLIQEG